MRAILARVVCQVKLLVLRARGAELQSAENWGRWRRGADVRLPALVLGAAPAGGVIVSLGYGQVVLTALDLGRGGAAD